MTDEFCVAGGGVMKRKPVECFHPREFINDELNSRGWTIDILAKKIGGDIPMNKLALDLYMNVESENIRLGSLADDLARVFGVSRNYFVHLENNWINSKSIADIPEKKP